MKKQACVLEIDQISKGVRETKWDPKTMLELNSDCSNSSRSINSTLSLFHIVPSPFPFVLFVYFSRSNSGPFLRTLETRTSFTFQNGLNPTIRLSLNLLPVQQFLFFSWRWALDLYFQNNRLALLTFYLRRFVSILRRCFGMRFLFEFTKVSAVCPCR